MQDPAKQEQALSEQVAFYRELQNVKNSPDVQKVLDLALKTAAEKTLQVFTSDKVKDWEDFTKERGEIVAYLYLVQEVRGAQAIADFFQTKLNELYPTD